MDNKEGLVKVDLESWGNQLKAEETRRKNDSWYNFRRTAREKFWSTFNWFKHTPYNIRRLGWSFKRAKKGWAPNDTWSLDWYLSNVIKESVKHLAENTHSYPGNNRFNTPEKWEHFLKSVSDAIEAYQKEEDDCEYTDIKEKMAKEEKAYKHMQKKLHQLVNVWAQLWD